VAAGVRRLLFGAITKSYGVERGILKDDAWTRFYRRVFTLERVLGVGGLLVLLGLMLNVVLFGVWAAGGKLELGIQLAALAQGLMIVGANLGLAGFLAMAVADRR
jgi:hypothetical protein